MIKIKNCFSRKLPLNSVVIEQKALKTYQHWKDCVSFHQHHELHKPEFRASLGWADRLRKRFSLRNVKKVVKECISQFRSSSKFSRKFFQHYILKGKSLQHWWICFVLGKDTWQDIYCEKWLICFWFQGIKTLF